MRLTDDYQYESKEEKEKEKEEENKKQTSKKPDKKEPPKKPTQDDLHEFNEWVSKKETRINSEIFQKHFSDILKTVYKKK